MKMGHQLTATHILVALCLIIICACANVTSSFDSVLWRNNERFQRNNCSKCKANLERNVQDVLPRLTLIKQRILNAIGRNPIPDRTLHSDLESIETRHAPEIPAHPIAAEIPNRLSYRMKEIVSYPESEVPGEQEGETIFKFNIHANKDDVIKEEALGASLLLYVDRRRKIRKGGRGKKIFLEISKLTNDNTWESLTYLQTRVRKRRWKRVSLPVKSAQELLESDSRNVDLKVRCEGCGRLVNIVIDKSSNTDLTKHRRSRRKHSKRSHIKVVPKEIKEKREKKIYKRKEKGGGTPFLIISTRVQV